MNNPPTNEINDLITRALRGQLTEPERRDFERRLQADKNLRETFELEQGLEHLLARLPSVPASTNFTSLVLQKVHSDQRAASIQPQGRKSWFRLSLSRLTSALAILSIAGVLALNQYRKTQQQQMVRSVTSFSEVASAISSDQARPELVFQDFEAINRLAMPADSELDLELLVALQK